MMVLLLYLKKGVCVQGIYTENINKHDVWYLLQNKRRVGWQGVEKIKFNHELITV